MSAAGVIPVGPRRLRETQSLCAIRTHAGGRQFDGCFFADLIGIYDIYGGSYETYVRAGGQISYLDPMVITAGDGG